MSAFRPSVPFAFNSRRYHAHPEQDPLTIFQPMINANRTCPAARWVELDKNNGEEHAVLVFTDGAASNNGYSNVRGGCGIALRPDVSNGISFPLERVGSAPLTSNRTELRAAHVALTLRDWQKEGFGKLVIGCDSQYVVRGACEWVVNWKENGWKNTNGRNVSNKDLWMMLIGRIEELERAGTVVQFYLILRRYNLADGLAKAGAVSDSAFQCTISYLTFHRSKNYTNVPTEWIDVAVDQWL